MNTSIRALRLTRGWTQQEAADAVSTELEGVTGRIQGGIDASWIGRLERGRLGWPAADRRAALRSVYGVGTDAELGLSGARSSAMLPSVRSLDLGRIEQLKRALDETFDEGAMATSTLDDWEQTVIRYGSISRDQPAGLLVSDLVVDLSELHRLLNSPRPLSSARRLTRVAAQMAGLLCLALIKLDNRPAFRGWARTARVAATEAGDPETLSWVLAQEAYGHYYSGDLAEALLVARTAQERTRSAPLVGAALAAALEARIHGALGQAHDCRSAVDRAEAILSDLPAEYRTESAFGYDEGQLRFHEGNAFTHLRDTEAAWAAQRRALELCAPGDFMDRAFARLDRAFCLLNDGEVNASLESAAETFSDLHDQQREGIITLRGLELLASIPVQTRKALPAARALHDRLMTPNGYEVESA